MPAQLILIAKVVGVSGEKILKRCSGWAALRLSEDSSEFEPSQWPDHARLEMDRFVGNLKANRFDPTIAYFDEYVDLWSSPATRWLVDLPRLIEVCSGQHELACYPLPDQNGLQDVLERLRRRRNANPEDLWFAGHALEALQAGNDFGKSAVLLIIRTVTGPLVEDSEIDQAVTVISKWLR